jgi:hypothetical protein
LPLSLRAAFYFGRLNSSFSLGIPGKYTNGFSELID